MPATASEGLSADPRRAAGRDPRTGPRRGRGTRWTVRLRLTVLYGGLFLLSGVALLGITYVLVASSSGVRVLSTNHIPGPEALPQPPDEVTMASMQARAEADRALRLQLLLSRSAIALALMSTVSVALGWLMAGRALRPVRTMADKARRISERNLHERLAVAGPDDELKELGDTFDGLLGRLDTAFGAQKRFVANASHELRTPLTLQRAMIEVTLADPAADAATLRKLCERLLATGEEQEELIEALLTLASSQRGLEHRAPVDLADVAGDVLLGSPPGGPEVTATLRAAPVSGDARLLERLVTNLVDNARRHNVPGGWVRLTTAAVGGRLVLRVVNSGPAVDGADVDRLFQPFQRGEPRAARPEGHGLGLSIVAAIAEAHEADVKAVPRPRGGLDVTVRFPVPR
ncbi:HAMP domain-containing sensor histidine kinase [Streptomyces sp. NPDC051940]|uniref:sensor histidine kinase n=1 Tax=Streptomyces sp. NPDC051940 TaxID=3155675 RepID=UPI00342FE543